MKQKMNIVFMSKSIKVSIIAILTIIFIIIPNIVIVFAEDLNELVLEIKKIDNLNKINNLMINNANKNNINIDYEKQYLDIYEKQYLDINKRYKDIDERFDSLSIDEKLQLLKMVRQSSYDENGFITFKENDSIILDVIDEAAQLAAEDGIFILELTDEEINQYVEKIKSELTDEELTEYAKEENEDIYGNKFLEEALENKCEENQSTQYKGIESSSSCPYYVYPYISIAKEPRYGLIGWGARSYSRAVNTPGESPCDYELHYSVNMPYVWSTDWQAKALLRLSSWKVGRRVYNNGARLLFGYLRTRVTVGNGDNLQRMMYIGNIGW